VWGYKVEVRAGRLTVLFRVSVVKGPEGRTKVLAALSLYFKPGSPDATNGQPPHKIFRETDGKQVSKTGLSAKWKVKGRSRVTCCGQLSIPVASAGAINGRKFT
jgi:hypothetical protein